MVAIADMKIALLADAHANCIALDAVLKDAASRNIDHIIFAGDAVGYYPYTNEVCNILREKADWCVKGNHDAFVTGGLPVSEDKKKAYALDYTLSEISAENMDWLKNLPEFLDMELSGKIFKIFHGSPWNYLEEYIYPDYPFFNRFDSIGADFVILGHTHHPMLHLTGDKFIINPGSCGQPRDYNPMASYSTLDIESGQIEFYRVSYDRQKIVQRLDELGFDETVIRILLRAR